MTVSLSRHDPESTGDPRRALGPAVAAVTGARPVRPDFSIRNFVLPPALEAHEPPEARGLGRDGVRLLVSHYADDRVTHGGFRDLPAVLDPGDLLVINTSGTMNAALPAVRQNATPLRLHLSTRLPADLWIVEPRRLEGETTRPLYTATPGETLTLPGEATATLHVPYHPDRPAPGSGEASARLWIATLRLPCPLRDYLVAHGAPIRYAHIAREWPLSSYQTVYATEDGSAEMPSAGRAFTPELLTQLLARGVMVAPLILHTGVSSLEDHEPPYEEVYRVSLETARAVNAARAAGRHVVAVGTTVVRALETVTDREGITHPGEGWTGLVITPRRRMRAVDALLTGLHEPRSTHLDMLTALAGRDHLTMIYAQALDQGYLWHEFGDLHLILP